MKCISKAEFYRKHWCKSVHLILFPCRYGMRFIAKTLKDTLNERFPDATEDELLKVCYIVTGFIQIS